MRLVNEIVILSGEPNLCDLYVRVGENTEGVGHLEISNEEFGGGFCEAGAWVEQPAIDDLIDILTSFKQSGRIG